MTRSIAATLLVLACATLSGCIEAHPFIRAGDANSVEVSYGGDVANTLLLARQHCGQYARVPRLVDAGAGLAVFDCVGP